MEKVIVRKKMKEMDYDGIADDISYNDRLEDFIHSPIVEKIKFMLTREIRKTGVSGSRAEILVNSTFSLIEMLVNDRFSTRTMNIYNKAIEFINKRLG